MKQMAYHFILLRSKHQMLQISIFNSPSVSIRYEVDNFCR